MVDLRFASGCGLKGDLHIRHLVTQVKTQATILLTVHTMNCLYPGRHEIPL